MNSIAPASFSTKIYTTKGSFTIHVNKSWAPAFAQRFYILSQLQYAVGGPFYRVLNVNSTTRFVSQFGYRAEPLVDVIWDSLQLSNVTNPVVLSNLRGTVAFGTNEIANDGSNPDCAAAFCSKGFTTELYINLANNSRLDASDFSPFGIIESADMHVIDSLYAGYGEVVDICVDEPDDVFCVKLPNGSFAGLNMTEMELVGRKYLESFPLLDYVMGVELLSQ
jgi:hypothetical protein